MRSQRHFHQVRLRPVIPAPQAQHRGSLRAGDSHGFPSNALTSLTCSARGSVRVEYNAGTASLDSSRGRSPPVREQWLHPGVEEARHNWRHRRQQPGHRQFKGTSDTRPSGAIALDLGSVNRSMLTPTIGASLGMTTGTIWSCYGWLSIQVTLPLSWRTTLTRQMTLDVREILLCE